MNHDLNQLVFEIINILSSSVFAIVIVNETIFSDLNCVPIRICFFKQTLRFWPFTGTMITADNDRSRNRGTCKGPET